MSVALDTRSNLHSTDPVVGCGLSMFLPLAWIRCCTSGFYRDVTLYTYSPDSNTPLLLHISRSNGKTLNLSSPLVIHSYGQGLPRTESRPLLCALLACEHPQCIYGALHLVLTQSYNNDYITPCSNHYLSRNVGNNLSFTARHQRRSLIALIPLVLFSCSDTLVHHLKSFAQLKTQKHN